MLADIIGGLCDLVEAEIEAFDLTKELACFRGRNQTGALSLEEGNTHRRFEIPDQSADGWLGDIHRLGSGRNASRHHHAPEGFDLAWLQTHLKFLHNIQV